MSLRLSHKAVILAVAAALTLGGCETLNSINPFGGSKKAEKAKEEKYDNRPLARETGELPPDTGNRSYTDDDLRPE